ncbi:nucleotide sugar dehydrogenase [archaeon]|nr:nucleotide sugar dehydrogenase [archaeon]NDB78633.1 nucleotide sugar dehydrogenase [archaeon]
MIGIVGQGFVGNAVYQKFKNYYDVLTNDLDENKSTSTIDNLVRLCDTIFLCLPTPMKPSGECDVSILEDVLDNINLITDNLETRRTVVIKSTIPPGTTEKFNSRYESLNIVFNPEFLTERNAVSDYENQNRIILGGPRPTTTELKQIFSKVFPKARIIKTNSTYAEMVKYTTNAFLSTKVSFANEIYEICQRVGADYDKVIEYATLDERLGESHWGVPGHDGDFGFGGHCFPKDLSALLYVARKQGSIHNVLEATQKTNDEVRKNRDWEQMKGRAVS